MHAGDTISYGAEYVAGADEWVATLPIGYADGWQRSYLGLDAIVVGERCPSVGRICRDQMIIRLPHEMPVGAKVTLIGTNGGQNVAVVDVDRHARTIAHDVMSIFDVLLPSESTSN